MTFNETLNLIYKLQANYPSFYTRQTGEQAKAMIELWQDILQGYDANLVYAAFKVAVSKKTDYPPNIAEINRELVKIMNPSESFMDGEQAWGTVMDLIDLYDKAHTNDSDTWDESHKHGDDYKRIISSNPILAKSIESCGGICGIKYCGADNAPVIRSQFIKFYNSLQSARMEELLVPGALKNEISILGIGSSKMLCSE